MKVDMSPAAIERRLRMASELRRLCFSLMKAGEVAGLYSPRKESSELALKDAPPAKSSDD